MVLSPRSCSVLAVLALGCVHSEPPPSAVPTAPAAAPASVVGVWLIDHPDHSVYEATEYSFFPNGQLTAWQVAGDWALGRVSYDGVECELGGTWRQLESGVLAIEGDCIDAQAREIVLGLGALGGERNIRVLSVGGQEGWAHESHAWRSLRCGDAPGLRCSEGVEQGAVLTLSPETSAKLPELMAACTSEKAGVLVRECAMLSVAVGQNDRRTLESVLTGDGDFSVLPLSDGAKALLAEVDAAGGLAAWSGGATPTIVSDCLNCARSMVRLSLTGADGSTWLLGIEGGHVAVVERAPRP